MRRHLATALLQATLLSLAAVAGLAAIQGAVLFRTELRATLRPVSSVRGFAVLDNGRAAVFAGSVYSSVEGVGTLHIGGVYDLTANPPRLKHRFDGLDPWKVCGAGQHAFVSIRDGTLYTYDLRTPHRAPSRLGRHDCYLPDVLQCADDGSVLLVAAANPRRAFEPPDPTNDGSVVYAVAAWSRTSRSRLWRRDDIPVTACGFMPNSGRLFVGLASGEVLELDPASGATVKQVDQHRGRVLSISVSPGQDCLASCDTYGKLIVTELPSGRRRWSLECQLSPCCRFSWDGRQLAVQRGNELALVCSHSGAPLAAMSGNRPILGVAAAPSGVLYACDGGDVAVWVADGGPAARRFTPARDWGSGNYW